MATPITKPVVGFSDKLTNVKQEFAPTMYAISKMRAGRSPVTIGGYATKDANAIYRPGLYVIPLNGSTNLLAGSGEDICYLYQLSVDPDDSAALGGHTVSNNHAANMVVRQIGYFYQYDSNTGNMSSIVKTRVGRKSADIPTNITTMAETIVDIRSLTPPVGGAWGYAFCSEIGMWVRYKNVSGHVDGELAVDWSEWVALGSGGASGYNHLPVYYLDTNNSVAIVNRIYVTNGGKTLQLPDASSCTLGDVIRIDVWSADTHLLVNGEDVVLNGEAGKLHSYTYEVTYDAVTTPLNLNTRKWVRIDAGGNDLVINQSYSNGVALTDNNNVVRATARKASEGNLGTVYAMSTVYNPLTSGYADNDHRVPTVGAVYSKIQDISSFIDTISGYTALNSANISAVSSAYTKTSQTVSLVSSAVDSIIRNGVLPTTYANGLCISMTEVYDRIKTVNLLFDDEIHNGVQLATLVSEEQTVLIAKGVPVRANELGVVKTIDMISSIPHGYGIEGMDPAYYTLPTMNAISQALAAISAKIGTGGTGGTGGNVAYADVAGTANGLANDVVATSATSATSASHATKAAGLDTGVVVNSATSATSATCAATASALTTTLKTEIVSSARTNVHVDFAAPKWHNYGHTSVFSPGTEYTVTDDGEIFAFAEFLALASGVYGKAHVCVKPVNTQEETYSYGSMKVCAMHAPIPGIGFGAGLTVQITSGTNVKFVVEKGTYTGSYDTQDDTANVNTIVGCVFYKIGNN